MLHRRSNNGKNQDIAELRQYSFHEDHLEIGGNVVLTDLENICLEAIEHFGPVKGQPFRAIHKQIRYFAGEDTFEVAVSSNAI